MHNHYNKIKYTNVDIYMYVVWVKVINNLSHELKKNVENHQGYYKTYYIKVYLTLMFDI
jgi:hypothetical protein